MTISIELIDSGNYGLQHFQAWEKATPEHTETLEHEGEIQGRIGTRLAVELQLLEDSDLKDILAAAFKRLDELRAYDLILQAHPELEAQRDKLVFKDGMVYFYPEDESGESTED